MQDKSVIVNSVTTEAGPNGFLFSSKWELIDSTSLPNLPNPQNIEDPNSYAPSVRTGERSLGRKFNYQEC